MEIKLMPAKHKLPLGKGCTFLDFLFSFLALAPPTVSPAEHAHLAKKPKPPPSANLGVRPAPKALMKVKVCRERLSRFGPVQRNRCGWEAKGGKRE
jgi:hypothetical protein